MYTFDVHHPRFDALAAESLRLTRQARVRAANGDTEEVWICEDTDLSYTEWLSELGPVPGV